MASKPESAPQHGGERQKQQADDVRVEVGGIQQRTFQETHRHNLLIRGRLVQCVMCSVCMCGYMDDLFVLLRASPPLLAPSSFDPLSPSLPAESPKDQLVCRSPSLVPLFSSASVCSFPVIRRWKWPHVDGRVKRGFSLRLLVFLCPWPWWGFDRVGCCGADSADCRKLYPLISPAAPRDKGLREKIAPGSISQKTRERQWAAGEIREEVRLEQVWSEASRGRQRTRRKVVLLN